MTVYFVAELLDIYIEPMSIKIGYSCDVARRIGQLQTGNPIELTLMGDIRTSGESEDRRIESALQKRFLSSQIRNEWFAIYPGDVIDGACRKVTRVNLVLSQSLALYNHCQSFERIRSVINSIRQR